jgi:HD superfamily phosphohydrolase
LTRESIRGLLQQDWDIGAEEVIDLINKRASSTAGRLLGSILSGPIDIDKMDYLYRDSLHCGVPYGQNFDAPRLIRSLCVDAARERLAITQKGKTAAELLVFARYVMFSEVYWHHAVRAATAMFQRAFYRWYRSAENETESEFALILEQLLRLSEPDLVQRLRLRPELAQPDLIDCLFGSQRRLYKRAATFSCLDGESTYRKIAQKPYPWLVDLSQHLAQEFSSLLGQTVHPDQVLIDAPPVGLEVQFDVQVYYPRDSRYLALETISPVVQTLAKRQFDDFVKQVRVFVDPALLPRLSGHANLREKVAQVLDDRV